MARPDAVFQHFHHQFRLFVFEQFGFAAFEQQGRSLFQAAVQHRLSHFSQVPDFRFQAADLLPHRFIFLQGHFQQKFRFLGARAMPFQLLLEFQLLGAGPAAFVGNAAGIEAPFDVVQDFLADIFLRNARVKPPVAAVRPIDADGAVVGVFAVGPFPQRLGPFAVRFVEHMGQTAQPLAETDRIDDGIVAEKRPAHIHDGQPVVPFAVQERGDEIQIVRRHRFCRRFDEQAVVKHGAGFPDEKSDDVGGFRQFNMGVQIEAGTRRDDGHRKFVRLFAADHVGPPFAFLVPAHVADAAMDGAVRFHPDKFQRFQVAVVAKPVVDRPAVQRQRAVRAALLPLPAQFEKPVDGRVRRQRKHRVESDHGCPLPIVMSEPVLPIFSIIPDGLAKLDPFFAGAVMMPVMQMEPDPLK